MGLSTAQTADGYDLAVESSGTGDPFILIPGLATDRGTFAALRSGLENLAAVISYDPRGLGDSKIAPPPESMDQMAADCIAVADAVGADQFDLLGASMGGLVAQRVALNFPDRVRRLILAATSTGHPVLEKRPEVDDSLLGRGSRTPEEAYRKACTVLYSERFQREHPEVIEEYVEYRALHPINPRVFRAQLMISRSTNHGALLQNIKMPALVLHGTEDELVPISNAMTLFRKLSNAHRYWFDGCGHLFFHEKPEMTSEVIGSYLKRGN